ncbi:LexA family protein [Burkholderia multivorans]|uniref:LexA family protein n=1 Tax=Burkholderia multivorans TaxID=87883 RepID=UPI00338F788C
MPISAGSDLHEKITIDRFLIQRPTKTVLIRVKGGSMVEAGIHDGDLAVVERTTEARAYPNFCV